MGFLQNRAIKKSCFGLATELINYVENFLEDYFIKLQQNGVPKDFDQLMLDALKNFIDKFRPSPALNVNFKSIQYSNWKDLYFGILIKGVYADLAYDQNIGTDEHNRLIFEISMDVFDSWVKKYQ